MRVWLASSRYKVGLQARKRITIPVSGRDVGFLLGTVRTLFSPVDLTRVKVIRVKGLYVYY